METLNQLVVDGIPVVFATNDASRSPTAVGEHLCEVGVKQVAAVVQGLGTEAGWSDLAEVGFVVQRGATWVVTNLDPMLPTSRGPARGCQGGRAAPARGSGPPGRSHVGHRS